MVNRKIQYIYITFFLVLFTSLFSQKLNGLYFEPTLSYKVFISGKSDMNFSFQTPYCKIEPTNQPFYNAFSPLCIGFNVGYKFKNSDKIQIGIASDKTYTGYITTGMSFLTDSSSVFTRSASSQSSGYKNFSLLYKRKVLFITSNALNSGRFICVHLNLGVNYNYFSNDSGFSGSGSGFVAPDSSTVYISDITYSPGGNTFKINAGIDFTIGSKEKEWFAFNVSYIYGRRAPSTTNITIDVNNKSGRYTYYHLINGTSNGIYFTLSKRIYLFKMASDKRERNNAIRLKDAEPAN